MKHLKILGFAIAAAATLVALAGAGSASGTELCKANESPCAEANMYNTGTVIHMESEGHLALKAGFGKSNATGQSKAKRRIQVAAAEQ